MRTTWTSNHILVVYRMDSLNVAYHNLGRLLPLQIKKGFTQWSPFDESTGYFQPSQKEFMINYRVENLEALVEELKNNGVTITNSIKSYDYGKFVHILDVEGNKIELWEPNDIEYEKIAGGRTK